MTNKLTRLIARISLPFVTFFLVLLPQQSFALVAPPAQLAAYGLPTAGAAAQASGGATAAAAAGAVDLFAAGALVAVGASISYFTIDYLVGPDNFTYRIPLRSDSPVPAPTASATASPTTALMFDYVSTGSYAFQDGETACLADPTVDRTVYSTFTGLTSQGVVSGLYQYYCTYTLADGRTGWAAGNAYGKNVSTYPNGYDQNGNLTDPRVASPDKSCDVSRTGSALAQLSADTDCAALPQQQINCSTGSCVITGVDSLGQPRRAQITPRPDGGSDIVIHSQRTISNTPVVDTRTITVSPAGVVTGSSGSTATGTLTTDGTAPTPGTTVTPTDVNLPTDYARTGEAAIAAKTITDADAAWRAGESQRWHDELAAPTAEAIPTSTFNVSITSVTFASNANCPAPITYNLLGVEHTLPYTPLCDFATHMRPLWLAMGGFAAAYIFFQGLKA